MALSQWNIGQVKTYFLLTARAHELIAGALAFFIAQKYPIRSTAAANALAVAGMTMMIGSLFLLTRGAPFPGVNSLYPCVGAAAVVFKDNPNYTTDISQYILRKRCGWIPVETNCNMSRSEIETRQSSMDRAIDHVGQAHPHMIVIDPKTVMCNAYECATFIGNTALYKDFNHINAKAAALLTEQYSTLNGNIFSGGHSPAYAREGVAPASAAVANTKVVQARN